MTVDSNVSLGKKFLGVLKGLMRCASILCLLYIFICSLDVLQDAFQLVGGRTAGEVLSNNELLNNPICGLMLGVTITVLVQSSSTSTSIVVTMVGSGLLQVKQAIPIVMGSNVGTTVTNTIVSLSQSSDREMFERAFAGATVHDMFNWMTVVTLMILEAASGYLEKLTGLMVENFSPPVNVDNPQFLKVITKPLTQLIVQVDKKVIEAIAQRSDRQKFPLMKRFCREAVLAYSDLYPSDSLDNATASYKVLEEQAFTFNVKLSQQDNNSSLLSWSELDTESSELCQHLFVNSSLDDAVVGGILLGASLVSMVVCLVILVKLLNSILSGPLASVVKRFINSDLPGPFSCLTGYLAIIIGAVGTILVQSSSVFTSALTPLVGLGIVSVERVYPLTLGSNIGTTITGILASFTADPSSIRYSFQIAMVHLFFNISGIMLFYPVPFMRRIPITLAKKLAKLTAKHRWFAGVYLVLIFIVLPLTIFALSMAGWYVLIGVLIPVSIMLIFVITVNIIQNKKPECLPEILKNWNFLPKPLRSLEPYENCFSKMSCCRRKRDSPKQENAALECGQDHHLLAVIVDKSESKDYIEDISSKESDLKIVTEHPHSDEKSKHPECLSEVICTRL